MLIAWKFAGYSLGEADVLRRAVSKKKKDVLIKEKNKFVTSSMNKGYSKEVAEEIYEYILKFANYGFNKAHSVAYSVIAYLTAYLKCHYPSYYFSVLLNSVIGTNNLLANYISEISKRHIKVEIPNINISDDSFKVINNTIVMPLTAIDGLGPSYVNEILNERKVKPFDNFEDFINALEPFGVNYYEHIVPLLNSNLEAKKQWDLCERVYRFNPLLEELAKGFGITPNQLDKIFGGQ